MNNFITKQASDARAMILSSNENQSSERVEEIRLALCDIGNYIRNKRLSCNIGLFQIARIYRISTADMSKIENIWSFDDKDLGNND